MKSVGTKGGLKQRLENCSQVTDTIHNDNLELFLDDLTIVSSKVYTTRLQSWLKNNRYFQISWVTYVRFLNFFLLCSYACMLYMLTISAILDCQCFKVSFVCLLFEKIDQQNFIKFCVKQLNEMCKEGHSPSLLWAEHKFNCGVTSFRKAEKMWMMMLVARTHQQSMKTLKLWIKWF